MQCFSAGILQIFAFAASFVTLNMTSSEWNYYWFDLNQPVPLVKMLIRAAKVTPFFLLPIVYKTMSLSLYIALLNYYAVIPIVILLIYQYIIQKRTGFLPQHITRGVFYNLCTIARPAVHATWNSRMAGLFRKETWGSLILHIIFLCIVSNLYEFGLLGLGPCTFGWFKTYVSVIAKFVMILGALNAVVTEIYLVFFPDIVLPVMEESAIEDTDKKLGWGAQRVDYKKEAKHPQELKNMRTEEVNQNAATSDKGSDDEGTELNEVEKQPDAELATK